MIGKTISHYKIIEKLGEGGVGEVYLADDLKLERQVAIKFLPEHLTKDKETVERFEREAKAAAAQNHPNIITIYDIIEAEDRLCIVMEYVVGKSLREVIEEYNIRPDEIADIIIQISEGLQQAHNAGIVHRDIKPDNIIVGGDARIRILDFGIAKLKGVSKLTKEITILGTTHFMSPEQIRGEKVDHRSDIWSLGVVLYELLNGEVPFKGDYEQAVVYSILNEEPTPLVDVAPEVQQIVTKTLAKNPDERYQSVKEIACDLRAIGDGQPGKKMPVSRQPKLPWMIATAMVAIMAIAFYFFMPLSKPSKAMVKTIAVLPFADMSPNKDQGYFSDGLSEELLNMLAKNPQLQVTSRTSSFSFKGTNADLKTIATKLNVKHILEGSVRKAGNNLRITAQLIEVEIDAHLWSETYDGTLDNIFSLQDSI